jgi:hypothetical protein
MPQPDRDSTVEIIVRWSSEASAAVHRTAADVGATVQPLHPAGSDPGLARYATLRVSPSQAHRVIAQLMSSPGVEAAYIKPAGEAP